MGPQLSFAFTDGPAEADAVEVSLRETTFVVVDLETTGGRARPGAGGTADAITEIGAVKIRGGEVLGEFATLIDPGRDIPPKVVELTGITSAMVRDAPPISAVLPMFLEFAHGAVLVAHNAGFDIGFLRAAAQQCAIPGRPRRCCVRCGWRAGCSAARKLPASGSPPWPSSSARPPSPPTAPSTMPVPRWTCCTPSSRGWATRVRTYDDLKAYLPNVSNAQRSKRALAQRLPRRPGVYLFRGPRPKSLYRHCRRPAPPGRPVLHRGRPRGRIKEMVALATAVDHVECAHPWRRGRELRLLAAHALPTTAGRGFRAGGGG